MHGRALSETAQGVSVEKSPAPVTMRFVPMAQQELRASHVDQGCSAFPDNALRGLMALYKRFYLSIER
jgi:hypothetical protein